MHEENNNKPRIGSARNAARSLIRQSKIKEPPVSLRTVIRQLQQSHDLQVYSYAGFSDKMSGMIITIENEETENDRSEIYINSNQHWRRRRFTIAHELGHLLLNTACSSIESYFDDDKTFEQEANAFASELLIPLVFLNKDLKAGGATIADLAWKYIVSQEAMGWKIASCNLLGKI